MAGIPHHSSWCVQTILNRSVLSCFGEVLASSALHIGAEVLLTRCERGDLISVPAGTRHWFDMGSDPLFCALRWFNNSEGWVAKFTGSDISRSSPGLD